MYKATLSTQIINEIRSEAVKIKTTNLLLCAKKGNQGSNSNIKYKKEKNVANSNHSK